MCNSRVVDEVIPSASGFFNIVFGGRRESVVATLGFDWVFDYMQSFGWGFDWN